MDKENKNKGKDLLKLFNMNNILSQIINFAAYIVLIASALIILYLSFIQSMSFSINWTTLGIYSGAAGLLTWINWNTFYKKQYEKVMAEDIAESANGNYSIHARYYNVTKDYDDKQLQKDIDAFNDEFIAKWLRWVEKKTGCPIETKTVPVLDENGNKIIDSETGKPKTEIVKGIKDLPYKGFKHKYLMWRIKTHRYPESGYKTSMELLSLLSFQDSNLNKRRLKADKQFFAAKSSRKLITSLLLLSVTGSIVPELVGGSMWLALLKLGVAMFSLLFAVFMGAMNGVRGARLKLSIVEDACADMERWSNKRITIEPYTVSKEYQQLSLLNNLGPDTRLTNKPNTPETPSQVAYNIFNNTNRT